MRRLQLAFQLSANANAVFCTTVAHLRRVQLAPTPMMRFPDLFLAVAAPAARVTALQQASVFARIPDHARDEAICDLVSCDRADYSVCAIIKVLLIGVINCSLPICSL